MPINPSPGLTPANLDAIADLIRNGFHDDDTQQILDSYFESLLPKTVREAAGTISRLHLGVSQTIDALFLLGFQAGWASHSRLTEVSSLDKLFRGAEPPPGSEGPKVDGRRMDTGSDEVQEG